MRLARRYVHKTGTDHNCPNLQLLPPVGVGFSLTINFDFPN